MGKLIQNQMLLKKKQEIKKKEKEKEEIAPAVGQWHRTEVRLLLDYGRRRSRKKAKERRRETGKEWRVCVYLYNVSALGLVAMIDST